MSWHQDVKTIIGIIIVVLFNIGTVIWGAATISTKVDSLTSVPSELSATRDRVARLEGKVEALEGAVGQFRHTMQNLAELITELQKGVDKNKLRLDYVDKEHDNGKR